MRSGASATSDRCSEWPCPCSAAIRHSSPKYCVLASPAGLGLQGRVGVVVARQWRCIQRSVFDLAVLKREAAKGNGRMPRRASRMMGVLHVSAQVGIRGGMVREVPRSFSLSQREFADAPAEAPHQCAGFRVSPCRNSGPTSETGAHTHK